MPAPRPLRSTDPRQVGDFTLVGWLGEGGQGTVFLGSGPDGEQVAVKLLRADLSQDSRARRYFERELDTVRRVADFCTARLLDFSADGEFPYIVSEYIDGPSLQEVVTARGRLEGPELDRLAIGTATALAAIHEAGVVHRDFKPANVLLGPDGPRVIDFGIARPLDATMNTHSGVVGTPAYMAPEQLQGVSVGPATDMFAWGCLVAYAANGAPPFAGESVPATLHRILNAEPDLGALTGTLRTLVSSCLDKDPSRRPGACDVLVRLLGVTNGGRQEDLLAEGSSAVANLTHDLGSALPHAPAATPAPLPAPAPGFPPTAPPPATWPAPAYGPGPRRRRRVIAGTAAGAAIVFLAAGGAVATYVVRSGGWHARQGAHTPGAAGLTPRAAAGTCHYLPLTGTSRSDAVKDVGTPPPEPSRTGAVRATMRTNWGTIVMTLDASKAPCTVNSFTYLAAKGFFTATTCHRLTTLDTLKVLQCGDPSGTGTGGPAYRFSSENTSGARYTRGTVAMANAGSPDTNGSQFFIVYGNSTIPPDYTVFGKVDSGLGTIDTVVKAGVNPTNGTGDGTPKKKIMINTMTIA